MGARGVARMNGVFLEGSGITKNGSAKLRERCDGATVIIIRYT